jgi:hypothetical protein
MSSSSGSGGSSSGAPSFRSPSATLQVLRHAPVTRMPIPAAALDPAHSAPFTPTPNTVTAGQGPADVSRTTTADSGSGAKFRRSFVLLGFQTIWEDLASQ